MEPTTIIIFGLIAGIILFGILQLIPKAKEHQAQLEKQRQSIDHFLKSQGFRIETPAKGDIKWIAHGQNFSLTFDSDFGSDSSTPTLTWAAPIKTSTDNQFIVISESAYKMFTHPTCRKIMAGAEKLAHKLKTKFDAETFTETLAIVDRKNTAPIAESKHHKYLLATSSAQKLGNLSNSQLASAASSLFSLETHAPQVGENRISHLCYKSTVTFYCQEPTVEQVRSILELGEILKRAT